MLDTDSLNSKTDSINTKTDHYQFKIYIGKKYAILATSTLESVIIPENQSITFEANWPYKAQSGTHYFGSKKNNKRLPPNSMSIHVQGRRIFGRIETLQQLVFEPDEILCHLFWFEKEVLK